METFIWVVLYDRKLNSNGCHHRFSPASVLIFRRPEEHDLVHWCHGAPGTIYLLARAYRVYLDDDLKQVRHAMIYIKLISWA